ncbi:glutamine--tRNA ligase/YqeY domain fusion protein [Membranihabitans maritimus]|uniref:glutamine--tRNA ligase/YqeY domain fusion protein n=1 Tax=Membranihabitans maritimus TaxID=2904244 RepID=UPI001F0162E2|nr:glutamine--tRNA ligase/YqeY domain fusion protein [Membranihabitans maritimus]
MDKSRNFIEQIIESDLEEGKHGGKVITRFPPEPNGYLHIGHAKSICLNFGVAIEYGGITNLRFDDTNPSTEETEYVESIKKDIHWLGYDWEDRLYYASDYFEQLYELAVKLIEKGLAYVDDSSADEIAEEKGTVTEPGVESKYRARSISENLELFQGMRDGKFDEGSRVLRAKIDMASPNLNMRDPLIYRIKKVPHHQTGKEWNIYPMYDFAHSLSDSIENITHSLCTLEFENHRPLYEWFIEKLEVFPSRQIEFARLNVNYMITSKRKLLRLVKEGYVSGWDDPRMPTISGMRRRGFTPASIRQFADRVGVAKRDNVIDISLLEFCVRDDLNARANRMMAVLNPLKVVIINYPEGEVEWLPAENNPEDPDAGNREMPFAREIFIERDDFMKDPPKKYFRMAPGRYTRLKHAYILHCDDFVEDSDGNIKEVHCTYNKDSKSGSDTSGIKAKGTLHWVSVEHAKKAEARLYDRLFTEPVPDGDPEKDFTSFVNPDSLTVLHEIFVEPSAGEIAQGEQIQFFRKGYFVLDQDSTKENLIFNRTITLKDSWAKIQKKHKK